MNRQREYVSTSEKYGMAGKTSGDYRDSLNHGGFISTCPQIYYCDPQEGNNKVWFGGTWLEELLNLPHDWEMICYLPVNFWKKN